jgi:hypothetical protein
LADASSGAGAGAGAVVAEAVGAGTGTDSDAVAVSAVVVVVVALNSHASPVGGSGSPRIAASNEFAPDRRMFEFPTQNEATSVIFIAIKDKRHASIHRV